MSSRNAAAASFVANRHKNRKANGKNSESALKPGDVVYRRGQACTIVEICYDTMPPHCVVRTEAGNEIGTEIGLVSRERVEEVPVTPPKPTRKVDNGGLNALRPLPARGASKESSATDQSSVTTNLAATQPIFSNNVEDQGDDLLSTLPACGSGTDKRHAALKRMRERRSERAREAAHDRDEALHGLLREQEDDSEEDLPHRQRVFSPERVVPDRSADLAAMADMERVVPDRSPHLEDLAAMEAQFAAMEAQLRRPQPAVASTKPEIASTRAISANPASKSQPAGDDVNSEPKEDKPKAEKKNIKKDIPRGGALGFLAESRGWVLPTTKKFMNEPSKKATDDDQQGETQSEVAEQDAESSAAKREASADPLQIMMRKVMEDELSPQRIRKQQKLAEESKPEAWKKAQAAPQEATKQVEPAVAKDKAWEANKPIEPAVVDQAIDKNAFAPEQTQTEVCMEPFYKDDQDGPRACSSTCAPSVDESPWSTESSPLALSGPQNLQSHGAQAVDGIGLMDENDQAEDLLKDVNEHIVCPDSVESAKAAATSFLVPDENATHHMESDVLSECADAAGGIDYTDEINKFLAKGGNDQMECRQVIESAEAAAATSFLFSDEKATDHVEIDVLPRGAETLCGIGHMDQISQAETLAEGISDQMQDMDVTESAEAAATTSLLVPHERGESPLDLNNLLTGINDLPKGIVSVSPSPSEEETARDEALLEMGFVEECAEEDEDSMQTQEQTIPVLDSRLEHVQEHQQQKVDEEEAKQEKAEETASMEELLRLQAQQAKAEAAEAQRKAEELEEKLRALSAELEARKNADATPTPPIETQEQADATAAQEQADATAALPVEMDDEDDADAPLPSAPIEASMPVEETEVQEPSVEVLLCVDASSAAHVPLSLAHTPVDEWDEDAWDEFGKHLRFRQDPCRLEPLGFKTLSILAPALRGLIVETQLCGEDPCEPIRQEQFDAVSTAKLWRRTLLGGTALWERAVAGAKQLRPCGLKCIVMVVSGADGRSEEPYCGDAGARCAADELLALGLPVHCVTLSAPKAETQCRDVSGRTGGLFVSLPAVAELLEDDSEHSAALNRLTQTLGNLPRRDGELDPQSFLEGAATSIQCAYRARVRRLKRQRVVRYKAALRIAGAYSRWRLRCCLREAALEAKRYRRAAPVRAAEKARQDAVREVEMAQAARVLQSYWRARKITLWCQRIDKGARRLQGWFRRRKSRAEAAKWRKMQILKRQGAADPPPKPPSQWLKPEPEEKEDIEKPKQEGLVLGKRPPQPWEMRQRDQVPSGMCPCPALRPPDRPRSRGDDTAALLPVGYAELPAAIMPSAIPVPALPRDTSLPSPRNRKHMVARAQSPSNHLASSMQHPESSRTPRRPPSPRHSTTNFCRRVPMGRSSMSQNRMGPGTAMPALGGPGSKIADDRRVIGGRRAMDRAIF